MKAVRVENLSYDIEDKKILDNISISLENKSFLGIVGSNGSGKTSLLKHIYRSLDVDKNTIWINGKDLTDYSFKESALEMTVMRQENESAFDYKVIDIVLMGRFPHRKVYELEREDDYMIARKALSYVDMKDYENRNFSSLSGGEKQRVLIARSIAQEADIYILDEPTNHLDIYYQWYLMQLMNSLNKSIISVFHDLNLALAYCDSIYVLKKGKIHSYGRPDKVFTKDLLLDVFGINAEIVQVNGKNRIIVESAFDKYL